MKSQKFTLNPSYYGIPDLQQLKDLRIWSDHYHGLMVGIKQHEEMMFYIERMGIEKVISLDIGGDTDPLLPSFYDEKKVQILETNKAQVIGIIGIDPVFPDSSCAKMEKYIRNGPCIGIKYFLNNKGIDCSHQNSDQIIRLAAELGAVIYIHTWLQVGGSPRYPGGGNSVGDSTPMDVAMLAKRFPNVPMICGYGGGDWELGVRAIRPYDNVLCEFSGSDPYSGSVDYAVNELGVDRIVWGGHAPSRSYATQLSRVLNASLSQADRIKILGENYRRTWAGIFRNKGIPF
jgi:predicted TIM-barrel fold metal-dependent hydrolase